MEIDILNEIITISVCDLFNPAPSPPKSTSTSATSLTLPALSQQPRTTSAPASSLKTENPSTSGNPNPPALIKRISLEPYRSEESREDSKRKSIESISRSDRSLENPNSATLKSPLLSTDQDSGSANNRRSRDSIDSGNAQTLLPQDNAQVTINNRNPPTTDQWLNKYGPQKLNESLSRMNLNINNMNKLSLSGLSRAQLETEKKNVKHELKRYDAAFVELFKRMPNREEKEPMKPLYIYYKRLKQYISLAENEEEKSNQPAAAEGSKLNSLNNLSVDSDRNQRATVTSTNRIGSYTLKEKENKSMMNATATGTLYSTQKRGMENSNSIDIGYDRDRDRDLSNQNRNIAGTYQNQNYNQNQQQQQQNVPNQELFKKKMNKEEAQRRLEILDAVKSQMREKLHLYQVEFTKNNNRKIKYHKDIVPVEEEYKRYKEVKEEIAMLEDFLKKSD